MIPQNKKIAILHPSLSKIWGATKMMIFLANFLKKKWNDVCFYTNIYDEKIFSKEIDFKVKVFNKIKISFYIRKSDFIIIWNSPMQFVWSLSKVLFFSKAKIIWWHHHYPWYYSENKGFIIFLKRFLEKIFLKFIDLLVWNSLYTKDILENIYKRKVKILSPVVDKEFLQYKNKKSFDWETLITYWRWVKWKNAKQIFDTYEFLKDSFQNLKLFIWWEGEELDFYKNKYKNDKKIKFLWLLDKKQIISYLEKSILFLFPSRIDSFGISALEAITIWVPVIAFNEKWVIEIIKNNKNWYLVSSEEEFKQKAKYFLEKKPNDIISFMLKSIDNNIYDKFEKELTEIFLEV